MTSLPLAALPSHHLVTASIPWLPSMREWLLGFNALGTALFVYAFVALFVCTLARVRTRSLHANIATNAHAQCSGLARWSIKVTLCQKQSEYSRCDGIRVLLWSILQDASSTYSKPTTLLISYNKEHKHSCSWYVLTPATLECYFIYFKNSVVQSLVFISCSAYLHYFN